MSYRGMTSAMLTAIASQQMKVIHLCELYLTNDSPQQTLYLTDYGISVVWNGNTYDDTQGLTQLSDPSETFALDVATTTFTVSGTELANLSLALTSNFTDARFVARRAIAQIGSSPIVITDPVVIFDGRIDSWQFTETPGSESSLTWNMSNHWVDFTRVGGRRTNSADQQLFYPGDLGLDYAEKLPANIMWPGFYKIAPGFVPKQPLSSIPNSMGNYP